LHHISKLETIQALVVYAYHPSYSGSSDQEDHCSKPALVNSSRDPILKNPLFKKKKNRAVGVAEGEGPEFKPQYCKNKKHTKKTPEIKSQIYTTDFLGREDAKLDASEIWSEQTIVLLRN
jgi:hypothetical protein